MEATQFRRAMSLALAMAISGCGWDRLEADREIDRLCKIDGGVRVIEHDDPPREFLRPDGTIDLQNLDVAKPNQTYYVVRTEKILQQAPEIARIESSLYRGADRRVLGTAVVYMRPRDHSYIISPFPKSKMCPSDAGSGALAQQVFRTRVSFF